MNDVQALRSSHLEGITRQLGAETQELLTLGETVERRFRAFYELQQKAKAEYGVVFEPTFAQWMESGFATWKQMQKPLGTV